MPAYPPKSVHNDGSYLLKSACAIVLPRTTPSVLMTLKPAQAVAVSVFIKFSRAAVKIFYTLNRGKFVEPFVT